VHRVYKVGKIRSAEGRSRSSPSIKRRHMTSYLEVWRIDTLGEYINQGWISLESLSPELISIVHQRHDMW
jgi:hypothetical protein